MNQIRSHNVNREQFVELSQGAVHYKLEGCGQPLLLIHGATVGLWEFDPLVPYLHDCGYQTLRLDLYGHGLSDRPDCRFDLALFVDQISELLSALEFPSTAHVLGHSMGAAVLSALLGRGDYQFGRAVLAAPLLRHDHRIRLRPLLARPWLGGALMGALGPMLLSPRRKRRLRTAGCETLISAYQAQVAKPGYWRSFRRLVSDGALGDHGHYYAALASASPRELLLLWGEQDSVIPSQDISEIRARLPSHEYQKFADMAHNLFLTHPERLARHIDSFFKS